MKTLLPLGYACVALTAAFADDRVGLEEPFDTTAGWVAGMDPTRPDDRSRPKAMKSEGGRLAIETQLGVLSGISSSFFAARNITPFPGVSRISKSYGEVDLTEYHFLVARMPVAQGCVSLRLNQKETKVLYTTGLHAQDIGELGFSGRTPVALQLILYNGTGRVVMDDVRLVSELTKEERDELIPDGFEIRPQRLKAGPYQGLEALYDRGRAPFSELLKSETAAGGMGLGEWAIFRDEATRAPIMKLTRYPGSDSAMQLSADGRWVLIKNALRPGYNDHVCDLRTHRVLALPPGQHEFFSKDGNRTALVSFNRKPPGGQLTVQECDLRAMKVTTLVDQDVPELPMGETEFSFSDESNKFVIGMRAHDVVFLVNPDASAGNRLRIIKLPQPLKGLRLANKDRFITFANCFTYQMLFYDYEAKQTHLRCQRFGGGHTAVGGGVAFGAYGSVLKLAVPLLDMAEVPGDAIRLHSNYRNSRVEVDYGTVSPDGRWAFQDGVKGDVDRQIVAFDLHEGGNVMPVFFHNTSSVGWDVKPYVRVSPDSTKVALYSCDMLGDGDVLMVPFQRPEPPRDIVVTRAAAGLALSWKPAAQSAETFGYNVYHSASRAGAFERLNDAPITATGFAHPQADSRSVFLVTAVDNSGLESRLPAPAMLDDRPRDDAANLFFEAECSDAVTLPFRRQYDGAAANFAAMRVMPERPEETEGALSFAIPADRLHAAGKRRYHVALRCRLRPDIYPVTKDAALHVAVDGRPVASVTANGARDFEWRFAQTPIELEAGKHELRITSRSAGVEVDRVAVCGVEQDFAWSKDSQNAEPELRENVVARAGQLAVAADGPFAMKLSWPAAGRGVAHYTVHASPKPLAELTNATLVGSTDTTRFRDTGLRPASALHYCVAAYDTRGRWVATYAGQGKTDALPAAHTIRFTPKSAKLGPAQELVTEAGRDFVRVKPGASASGPTASVHFDFDLPKAGDYTVWFRNRPQSENRYITCRLDNILGSFWAERWMLPGERVEMINLTGRKPARWYVNRLLLRLPAPRNADGIRGARIAAQDVFPLKAGAHSIELSFVVQDPKSPATDISELIVTNDLTWQPDDHDPRAQFAREE